MSFSNEQPVHPDPPEPGQAPPASGSRKWIGAAAAAAVVVALSVGGVAFVKVLGGGGAQPEDVLPANAFAFAKLDLNPTAGQKVAAFQLTSKLPKAKGKDTSDDTPADPSRESSLKESVFGSIFTGEAGMGLDYKADVGPWLGDRIGVGVFPDMDADKQPEVGLAIAFTDQGAAKAALDKAVANAAKKQEKAGYAFADGYVIVSDTTAHAAALVQGGQASPLAGSRYREDVESLGTDQIGVAWTDLAPALKAIPKDRAPMGETAIKGLGDPSKASGRFVAGLHLDSSFVELNGRGIDVKGVDSLIQSEAGAEAGLIASFPAEVFGAVTVNGLGKRLGAVYTSVTAQDDSLGIRPMLDAIGIGSAGQVESLLGAETGVMVGGATDKPQLAIRTRGSNPDAALAIADKALAGIPIPGGLQIRKVTSPPGIVVGTKAVETTATGTKATGEGADLTNAILDPSGRRLGDTEVFRQVIPEFAKADLAAYLNLTKVVAMGQDPAARADLAGLKPFSAVGLTATGGAEPTFRIRISIK